MAGLGVEREALMLVSFCIPARNESKDISKVIQSIVHVTDKQDYTVEILVGDHGSVDNTAELARSENAIVVDCADLNTVAQVRNRLAAKSRGEVLVFLDADVYLTFAWGMYFKPLRIEEGTIVGSYPEPADSYTFLHRHWSQYIERDYVGSGHMIMRRLTFDMLHGFKPDLVTGEDFNLCERARYYDMRVINQRNLVVIHGRVPHTVPEFFSRERWHGEGDWDGYKPASSLTLYSAFFTAMLVLTVILLFTAPMFAIIPITLAWGQMVFLMTWKVDSIHIKSILPFMFLSAVYMVARTCSVTRRGRWQEAQCGR